MALIQGGAKGAGDAQHAETEVIQIPITCFNGSHMLCRNMQAARERLHGHRRFATPSPEDDSGLFVASCLLTRAPIGSEKEDGSRKAVIRPYTPVTTPDTKGYFDLVRSLFLCCLFPNSICIPMFVAHTLKHVLNILSLKPWRCLRNGRWSVLWHHTAPACCPRSW